MAGKVPSDEQCARVAPGGRRMIGHGQLLQACCGVLRASIDGAAAYVDDLNRMRAVLVVAPRGFPWWTAAWSGVLLLCFTGLAAGPVYLNRRMRRMRALATAPPLEC